MDEADSLEFKEESEEKSNEVSSEFNSENDENWGISYIEEKKFWYTKILNIYAYQSYECLKCKKNKLGI